VKPAWVPIHVTTLQHGVCGAAALSLSSTTSPERLRTHGMLTCTRPPRHGKPLALTGPASADQAAGALGHPDLWQWPPPEWALFLGGIHRCTRRNRRCGRARWNRKLYKKSWPKQCNPSVAATPGQIKARALPDAAACRARHGLAPCSTRGARDRAHDRACRRVRWTG